MKKFLLVFFANFLLFSCAFDEAQKTDKPQTSNEELSATEFVKGSEDIPLIDGLEQIDNDALNFDSDAGSIATTDYKSLIDLEAVQNFYLKTLPQMGWKLIKNDQKHSKFVRESEKIEIEFIQAEEEGYDDVVRFFLSSVVKN